MFLQVLNTKTSPGKRRASLLTQLFCLLVIPETPSRDPNGHDDVEAHLGKENEEEDEEVEGAVTPIDEKQNIS